MEKSKREINIAGFSPNCLIGATEAIANYLYGIDNLHKIYFHHSYVYKKETNVIEYDEKKNCLNILFSREIPINKTMFIDRLKYYYGIGFFYKNYSEYTHFLEDLKSITNRNNPAIIEIDFYYMRKHIFYHQMHDMHLMIAEKVDLNHGVLHVCDAVFGHITMAIEEYKAFFENKIINNNKKINIILIKKDNREMKKINIKWFTTDLEYTELNLIKEKGLANLKYFKKDILNYLSKNNQIDSFVIPGMWVFMCDNFNNYNFIKEFKKDYSDFNSVALDNIRKLSIQGYRKWFELQNMLKEPKRYEIEKFIKVLTDIENIDEIFIKKIEILKADLIEYTKIK